MRSDVRHQLKRDKFAETTTETMHWAVEHRARLLLYGGVLVAVIVLAISYIAVRHSQEQAASIALANAFETYGAPVVPAGTPAIPGQTTYTSAKDRATAANKAFATVANKYSTQSGEVARYMEGVTASEMDDPANAEKELKQVVDHGNADLSNLAKYALASVYRQTGRDQDAINLYQELSSHPTRSVGKSMADLELASIYAAKQPDKAKILLQQIAKDNPNTAVAELATQKLAEIK
ncbi:MAG TPA: tetratricopeptide repeat protein [Candidatus Koribacter sp.]